MMDRLFESIGQPLQVRNPKRLSGIFTVLDEFNQNGRRYPETIYLDAYRELVPKIKEHRLLGELDHPLDYDEVRLSNVSHVIVKCSMTESNTGKRVIRGTVELLDTPAGKIAQALVKAGIPLGISSRAVGNTKKVPEGVDVTQLKLITYDLVAEPSFSTAILSEEKANELSESLSYIESKLPLNESADEDPLREKINSIRESLCLQKTIKETKSTINESANPQTLEVAVLKKMLESSRATINKDTDLLRESRHTIKRLRKDLNDVNSRYDSLKSNHQELQESYNNIQSQQKLEESKTIEKLTNEIVDLRKRLAVEQRGMSYAQVSTLLEGVSTMKEINAKLDTISSIGKRSNVVTPQSVESIKESLSTTPNRNKLSGLISRV